MEDELLDVGLARGFEEKLNISSVVYIVLLCGRLHRHSPPQSLRDETKLGKVTQANGARSIT